MVIFWIPNFSSHFCSVKNDELRSFSRAGIASHHRTNKSVKKARSVVVLRKLTSHGFITDFVIFRLWPRCVCLATWDLLSSSWVTTAQLYNTWWISCTVARSPFRKQVWITGIAGLNGPGFGRPRRFHTKRGWPKPKAQIAPLRIQYSKGAVQALGLGSPLVDIY